jgi:hypothetical protein
VERYDDKGAEEEFMCQVCGESLDESWGGEFHLNLVLVDLLA